MKREDLQKIEGLTKEQIDSVMKLHNEDVTGWNQKISEQKAEVSKRQSKIDELTDQVNKFDGVDVDKLKQDIEDWKTKYNTDLAAKDKEYAVKLLFDSVPFASNLAKKAAMSEFIEKDLEFKDGKFLGADDFIKALKESDPTAFKEETAGKKSTGMPQGKPAGTGDEEDGVMKKFFELNPALKD